ncbi:phage shock protein A, PspA [Alkalidesulfovibrio alkalitolerans DSM 16529]|jgi:phage shock protein A|uniref:Phage shock protein A, PspA n=1 Tax=Alkalidesulfovibrio alkalitolerans DSM 16529 TaxID=1121439 RepID=S7T8I9_9BACT|nr:phage shock protein PspA [Alkalidesulfovibrio alkalitolerans]EPR32906.1 phage shock protein A, PspA [Alkalidesulfovibrio alkalitolerans DSM 16529]
MGIFSRFKDIISANLNSMLDKAEDPEKMIRLMVREMEETLVELKASCASAMAARASVARDLDALSAKVGTWEERARLAVSKGRDDLAREALAEKKRLARRIESLDEELGQADALVGQAQEDIAALEAKLASAREKQRMLVQRHGRAEHRTRCRRRIQAAESSDAFLRFDRFEREIERMEAEAEVEGLSRGKRSDLEDEFRQLERDEDVERELSSIKRDLEREPRA